MANGTIAASQLEMLTQSGTGIITIVPPATNTNRTLTLPDSTGTVVASGTTPSLNGIAFPATQAASTDANTLDDYEEGTWTPSIGGTATYYTQAGTYTKIGNVVTVAFDIFILLKGTGSATTVSGLPFTTANTIPYNENGSGVAYFSSIATSVTYLTAVLNKNATTLHFDGLSAAAATMPTTINVFQNTTDVYCTITYIVA